jgi:hypothetical protein
MNRSIIACCALGASLFLAGCKTQHASCSPPPKPGSTTTPTTKTEPSAVIGAVTAAPLAAAPASIQAAIRIKAGSSSPLTDAAGKVWLAEQGFEGGDVIERPDLEIGNTKSPEIYRSEHYAMEAFSWKIPNGKYQVKLHFAETFEGIAGPGERVFSFNVEGQEFKDFDIWKKAGGGQRAYVETVSLEIQDGKLDIKFTSNIENPTINGIEIIPVL